LPRGRARSSISWRAPSWSGSGFASAKNPQVGAVGSEEVLAYHALWHLIGAFGFLALFVFNQLRFANPR
jgi:hypothetical protein